MIGNKLKLSIFGESHGSGVGICLDGFPAGMKVDREHISLQMKRRQGGGDLSTPRFEPDECTFMSGIFEEHTTGAPICIFIPNTNQRSGDYSPLNMRPGHADYPAYVKYGGMSDYRGGGHFSGRLTASLVAAGALAQQYLKGEGVQLGAHIYSIGGIEDTRFGLQPQLDQIGTEFPVLDASAGERMKAEIKKAMENNDSVGGIIEAAATGVKAGVGSPFWNSMESVLSHLLFSIPAVKGVEFGAGFDISRMRGSGANDEMYFDDGQVKTYTNNNGGICGGITNGMPLIVRAAFKPTASIAAEQRTIDITHRRNSTISVQGRHDPCVVTRAVPVVEAAVALGIMDLILFGGGSINDY